MLDQLPDDNAVVRSPMAAATDRRQRERRAEDRAAYSAPAQPGSQPSGAPPGAQQQQEETTTAPATDRRKPAAAPPASSGSAATNADGKSASAATPAKDEPPAASSSGAAGSDKGAKPAGTADGKQDGKADDKQDDKDAQAKKPTSHRTKIIRAVAIAAVVLIGIGYGIHKWSYSRVHETTDDAQVAGDIVPVIPRVSGYVARVYITDNQFVHEGDTLFVLDPRDYQIRYEQAKADLLAAVAAGKKGSGQQALDAARAQRTALNANVDAAQATADRAQRDYERYRILAAKQIVSQQQLDQAEQAYRSAVAVLAASNSQAAAGSDNATGAGFQLQSADYRVVSAQAAVDSAKLQLTYTIVRAAADGRIGKRSLEPGQFVQPGQQLCAITMAGPSHLWVVANMKETQVHNIRVGQHVSVSVDAFGGHDIDGRVNSFQDATGAQFTLLPPDNSTGNFTKIVQRIPVKITLDSVRYAGEQVSPGMNVTVAIDTPKDSSRTARPDSTVASSAPD
jgi:membrane fusion protein (multidrug efflux system)